MSLHSGDDNGEFEELDEAMDIPEIGDLWDTIKTFEQEIGESSSQVLNVGANGEEVSHSQIEKDHIMTTTTTTSGTSISEEQQKTNIQVRIGDLRRRLTLRDLEMMPLKAIEGNRSENEEQQYRAFHALNEEDQHTLAQLIQALKDLSTPQAPTKKRTSTVVTPAPATTTTTTTTTKPKKPRATTTTTTAATTGHRVVIPDFKNTDLEHRIDELMTVPQAFFPYEKVFEKEVEFAIDLTTTKKEVFVPYVNADSVRSALQAYRDQVSELGTFTVQPHMSASEKRHLYEAILMPHLLKAGDELKIAQLFNEPCPDVGDTEQLPFFLHAVRHGKTDHVERMVGGQLQENDVKTLLQMRSPSNQTILHCVALAPSEDVAKMILPLLDYFMDIYTSRDALVGFLSQEDTYHATAIQNAMMKQNLTVVKWLRRAFYYDRGDMVVKDLGVVSRQWAKAAFNIASLPKTGGRVFCDFDRMEEEKRDTLVKSFFKMRDNPRRMLAYICFACTIAASENDQYELVEEMSHEPNYTWAGTHKAEFIALVGDNYHERIRNLLTKYAVLKAKSIGQTEAEAHFIQAVDQSVLKHSMIYIANPTDVAYLGRPLDSYLSGITNDEIRNEMKTRITSEFKGKRTSQKKKKGT